LIFRALSSWPVLSPYGRYVRGRVCHGAVCVASPGGLPTEGGFAVFVLPMSSTGYHYTVGVSPASSSDAVGPGCSSGSSNGGAIQLP
jgi:hypothetical protein